MIMRLAFLVLLAAASAAAEAEAEAVARADALPAATLKSISDGKKVSYPEDLYTPGANAAFAAPGRSGIKSKTKACVNCFLFNSKQKLAKKYSIELQRNMQAAIRKERLDTIAQQLVYGDEATMRERTGDRAYGTGSQSDMARRLKDAAEKKCLDRPPDQQAACLKKAKAMEPGAWLVWRGAWHGVACGVARGVARGVACD